MSRPQNILNNYRSYRYYHVLALCDRASTAEALVASTDLSVWSRNNDNIDPNSPDIGKWTPRTIRTADSTDGLYSILIHGATDADMIITDYKVTSYTAASVTSSDQNTSLATEGQLDILEPKGVVFFDLLTLCMNAMQSDAVTNCFVLKTFFVGHAYNDIDGEYQSNISDITPVMFFMLDATASYTENGGVYNLQFVALVNGAARLPQFARAASGAHVSLAPLGQSRASVKVALTQLFNVINANYKQHYGCVIAVAASQGIENPESVYYPVSYQIEVDDVYDQEDYSITDAPIQYKIGGDDCFSPPPFKNLSQATIEDAIHTILKMCPRIKRDMVDGVGVGENAAKYEYKIHSSVVTSVVNGSKQCTVKYIVKRFLSPRGLNIQRLLTGDNTILDSDFLKQNVIEFDYLFSGKNIDILDFDIKMNYGLAFLQTATTANSLKQQLEIVASRSTHVSSHMSQPDRTGKTLPTPVFFAPQLVSPMNTNTQNPAITVQSSYTMAKHASLEVAEASVKIIGNPRLYNSVAMTTNPSNMGVIRNPQEPVDNGLAASTLDDADFRYWGYYPSLTKINIYMPRNNDDVALLTGQSDVDGLFPDYSRKFWYDGYYYVYGIEHAFSNGEFTQQLMMVAMPNGVLASLGEATADKEKAATSITECYNSKISPQSPSTTREPVEPFTKPSAEEITAQQQNNNSTQTSQPPVTVQDANTVNTNAALVTDVVGWDKASEDVKIAILTASSLYKVNPTTMAQIAAIESSFNPSAKAPTSTASGLYQHINNTWYNLVTQNRIKGIPATTTRAAALPLRFNPQLSANGGAALLSADAKTIGSSEPGDLYLSHFLGVGRARSIVRAYKAGNGNSSLVSVLGAKAVGAIKGSNPPIRPLQTVNDLRAWAATKMASKLKTGIRTAVQPVPVQSGGSKAQPASSAPVSAPPVTTNTGASVINRTTDTTTNVNNPNKRNCGDTTPTSSDGKNKTNPTQPNASTPTNNPTQ